jgi:hypothetical protein
MAASIDFFSVIAKCALGGDDSQPAADRHVNVGGYQRNRLPVVAPKNVVEEMSKGVNAMGCHRHGRSPFGNSSGPEKFRRTGRLLGMDLT